MNGWSFRDYLDASGDNVILHWLSSRPQKAQARIDNRILTLQASSVWSPQYVSALTSCKHIFELKIVSGGVQYRPLGCFGLQKDFFILLGAIEKGGKLPRSACSTAQQRRKIVLSDRSRSCEHQFSEEAAGPQDEGQIIS